MMFCKQAMLLFTLVQLPWEQRVVFLIGGLSPVQYHGDLSYVHCCLSSMDDNVINIISKFAKYTTICGLVDNEGYLGLQKD